MRNCVQRARARCRLCSSKMRALWSINYTYRLPSPKQDQNHSKGWLLAATASFFWSVMMIPLKAFLQLYSITFDNCHSRSEKKTSKHQIDGAFSQYFFCPPEMYTSRQLKKLFSDACFSRSTVVFQFKKSFAISRAITESAEMSLKNMAKWVPTDGQVKIYYGTLTLIHLLQTFSP